MPRPGFAGHHPTRQHHPSSPSCHPNLASPGAALGGNGETSCPSRSPPRPQPNRPLSPLIAPAAALISLEAGDGITAGDRGPPRVSDRFSHTFLANEKFPLPGCSAEFFLAPVSLPHLCLRRGRLSHGGVRATSRHARFARRPGAYQALAAPPPHLFPRGWRDREPGKTKTPMTHPGARARRSRAMP